MPPSSFHGWVGGRSGVTAGSPFFRRTTASPRLNQEEVFGLRHRSPSLPATIPRMKLKFFPPFKDEGAVMAS